MDILENIITAVSSGELNKLKELIEKNPDMVNKTNSNGLTPLAAALLNDKMQETEYLLTKDADKNSSMQIGKTAIEWAKEQDNNNSAFLLIAWDYLDRLYAAAALWKKHKIKEAICDVCSARITEDDSTMLTIDEAFMADNYVSIVINQAKKLHPSLLEKKTTDKIKEIIKEQITKATITGRYFVCEECIEKYFLQIIFGKNRDKVFEIVTSMFEEN